jgi:hypothetical protein
MKRRSLVEILVIVVIVAGALGVFAGMFFVIGGVSARPEPSGLERTLARTVRDIAIGRHARHEANPVPKTDEAIAAGRAHFADHCGLLPRQRRQREDRDGTRTVSTGARYAARGNAEPRRS